MTCVENNIIFYYMYIRCILYVYKIVFFMNKIKYSAVVVLSALVNN